MRTPDEIQKELDELEASPSYYGNEWKKPRRDKLKAELRCAITDSIPLSSLREICDAEREQRCVVLPCKVGDAVWLALDRLDGKPTEIKQSRLVKYIRNTSTEFVSCYIDCKAIGNTLEFALSDFGKTVFLTRAEAEAAKGEKQ